MSQLCRSFLFTPADRLLAVSKSLAMRALDMVIIDLEDAVGVASKESSREGLVGFFKAKGSDLSKRAEYPKLMIRINCPVSTPFGLHDLEAMLPHVQGIDAILIPKVESHETITRVADKLKSGSSTSRLSLWCMIESTRGVEYAHAISRHSAVSGLVFGSNDMTKDLRAQMTVDRSQLQYSLSRTVNAARAEGKMVVDGVFMDLSDDGSGLEKEAIQGRELGFDGKSIIHPKQLDVVNRVFSPSQADVLHAQAVCDAFAEAQKAGKGVAVLGGKLVEALHVEQAHSTLSMFNSIKDRG